MFLCPKLPAAATSFLLSGPSTPSRLFVDSNSLRSVSLATSLVPSPARPHLWTPAAFRKSSGSEEAVLFSSHAVGRNEYAEIGAHKRALRLTQRYNSRGSYGDRLTATQDGLGPSFDEDAHTERGGDLSGQMEETQSRTDRVHSESEATTGMKGRSVWGKLKQNVNFSGIVSFARVTLKDRQMAIPHVSVPDISWVDWRALRAKGFDGVVFDKDNTLTAPYALNVWPSLKDSLEECREVFAGRIALLSNSAGLYQFDPAGEEAKVLENQLGIPVIRHGQKKPAGNALALSKHFGCDPFMLVMVGDRHLTDIVYGNSNGLLTICSAPLTTLGEPFTVKRVRSLEGMLVDWWRRKGVQPPGHKFLGNPVDFIKDPGCW